MHPEDEGIYETADPDRGSNTRGETPDCERYCKTLRHEKSYGFTIVAIIHCHRDILSAHVCITPSLTNPTITHIYISDKDGACVVVLRRENGSKYR